MSNPFDLPPRAEPGAAADFYATIAVLCACGSPGDAERALDRGELYVTARVGRVLKALVGGASTAGWDVNDLALLKAGFYSSLAGTSAFFKLLPDTKRIPFRARIAASSSVLVASVIGEGQAIPISAVAIGKPMLEPVTLAAAVVLTSELAKSLEAEALIRTELRNAVARGADSAFVQVLLDAGVPQAPASGGTEATLKADLAAMLSTVVISAAAKPYFIAGVGAARSIALVTTGWTNSAVSPTAGGQLVGVPLTVSDGIADDDLLLADAASIAANSGPLDLRISREASYEPESVPVSDAVAPTGAQLISLFQDNSLMARVVATIGCSPMRANAGSLLTDFVAVFA